MLEPIQDEFDFIFIDCPPSLGLLTINALTAADSVLIPIQCEYYALEGVQSYFGDKAFKTLIPRTVKISEAPSFGEPVITYAPQNKGAKAYMNLAKEVIKRA